MLEATKCDRRTIRYLRCHLRRQIFKGRVLKGPKIRIRSYRAKFGTFKQGHIDFVDTGGLGKQLQWQTHDETQSDLIDACSKFAVFFIYRYIIYTS